MSYVDLPVHVHNVFHECVRLNPVLDIFTSFYCTIKGAANTVLSDPEVTHLVVSDEVDPAIIPSTPSKVKVVKQQWFWESIQIEACADEQLYLAKVCKVKFVSFVRCTHTCTYTYTHSLSLGGFSS